MSGNYRDMDAMQYASNIAIFDTIRYIVPSLQDCWLYLPLSVLVPVPQKIAYLSVTQTLHTSNHIQYGSDFVI